jgi:hypothetical protein
MKTTCRQITELSGSDLHGLREVALNHWLSYLTLAQELLGDPIVNTCGADITLHWNLECRIFLKISYWNMFDDEFQVFYMCDLYVGHRVYSILLPPTRKPSEDFYELLRTIKDIEDEYVNSGCGPHELRDLLGNHRHR